MDQRTVVVSQIEGAEPVREELVLPAAAPANEGKTSAAWILTLFGCIGSLVVAIGMVMASTPAIWAGVVVLGVGALASAIMRGLGYGQPRSGASANSS
ncbi:MAG: HGxxPAAW family protein [Beutenbergiaceae bacterium]